MPRPVRRTSWTACILFLISAAGTTAWAVSIRWTIFRMAQFGDAQGIKSGEFFIGRTTPELRRELSTRTGRPLELEWTWQGSRRQTPMVWVPYPRSFDSTPPGRSLLTFPLWVPPVPCAALGLWLWRRHRRKHRRSRGHCPECGYNRAGIAGDALCPECGASEPHRTSS